MIVNNMIIESQVRDFDLDDSPDIEEEVEEVEVVDHSWMYWSDILVWLGDCGIILGEDEILYKNGISLKICLSYKSYENFTDTFGCFPDIDLIKECISEKLIKLGLNDDI